MHHGSQKRLWTFGFIQRIMIFFSVLGPATITAMADNDAAGVATYSIAGAKLGYPILFFLIIITVLLGITQEMGMRLTLTTGKGLADHIREQKGIKVSMFMFACLFIANMGTIIVDLAAMKTASSLLNLPVFPVILFMLALMILMVTKGNYKFVQNTMLIACLFYVAYVISAFNAKPDWGLALRNLAYPQGVAFTPEYLRNYLLIGMGVLGTTITPWGQFFISSFAFDKKIDALKMKYSQFETYLGAFLTDFFSFFMIVATAATLFVHNIPLISGEQAAIAIKPFAGELAGTLFGIGILNAGFMGVVVVALSTAYAFSEFFGFSGSLDSSFNQSKSFYILFLIQLGIASLVVSIPGVSLFSLAVFFQSINAMVLPLVFLYLIKFTNNEQLMGKHKNNTFQSWFSTIASIVIVIASIFAVSAMVMGA